MRHRRLIAARLRVRDERGIALVMAVLILAVLATVTLSMLVYTSSNSRSASSSQAGQKAYALAEAGLNAAAAQLASHYAPASSSATTLYDDGWVGGSKTLAAGTASWTGTFTPDGSGYGGTWLLTGTGSVSNPTGPSASALTRTVTGKVDVAEQPLTDVPPTVWNYVYSGHTGSACDLTIDQTVTFTAPLYMPGNLCLQNQGAYLQPGAFLAVGGNLDVQQQQGSVGTAANRISQVSIGGSCSYQGTTFTPCQANITGTKTTPTSNVWASTFSNTMPLGPGAPTIDWNEEYDRASPGPYRQCSSLSSGMPSNPFDQQSGGVPDGRNDNAAAFVLFPSTSYTCETPGGKLDWNATTHVLDATGNIYFDGDVLVEGSNTWVARYTGDANIYASGSILIKNNTTLCARVSGTTCDWSGWQPGNGDPILLFIGNGSGGTNQIAVGDSVEIDQSDFQGGVYGTNAVEVRNGSDVQGPIVTPNVIMPGQSAVSSFPNVDKIGVGAPGDGTPPQFTMGKLYDTSY